LIDNGVLDAQIRVLQSTEPIQLLSAKTRSLLAADFPSIVLNRPEFSATEDYAFIGDSKPEGEAANDLVTFAKALTQAKVRLYGAPWDDTTTVQKLAFEEGADFLDFVDISNPDRSPNQIASDLNITEFPVWILENGTRLLGLQTLAGLSTATGVAIPQSSIPSVRPIDAQAVEIGSPFHVPVNAYDPNGNPLSMTVTSSNPENVVANVLYGNQSAQIATDFGFMTFQLFNREAQRPVDRFTALAQSGFYDTNGSREMTFHRVIENFVIQGGDPKGDGTGGSGPNFANNPFDDEYNVNLQHNRSGILSYAKTNDDTNDSQFFITAGPTRHLDFNHSIFGQLTDGELTRAAIAKTAVAGIGNVPVNKVIIRSINIFDDRENGLIRLVAAGAAGSQSTITVTVRDSEGHQVVQSFVATVSADADNGVPFLNDIPLVNIPTSNQEQQFQIQLTSQDSEGDAVQYYTQFRNAQSAFLVPPSGIVTVTPPANSIGPVDLFVVAIRSGQTILDEPIDVQLLTLQVGTPLTFGLSGTPRLIEGASQFLTATVARPSNSTSQPLTLTVNVSHGGQLEITPQSITIPAGQTSATFEIRPTNDTLVDGNRRVTVFLSAVNHWTVSQTIEVIDNDAISPWHKLTDPTDVDNDNQLTVFDVLTAINQLNRSGAGIAPIPPVIISAFADTDGDHNFTPFDILRVINAINRQPSGGGEGEGPGAVDPVTNDNALAAWVDEELIGTKTRRAKSR
jgi:large repetitive protein